MSAPGVRRFDVEHVSEFRYGEAARGSLLALRLRPRTDATRRLLDFSLHVDPPAAPIVYSDAFGNVCHLVNIHREHRHTLVRSAAQVEVVDTRDSSRQAGTASWDALAAVADPVRYWDYLSPSRLAFPCPALDSFTRANGVTRGRDPLSSLRHAASTLRSTFTYEPGSTAVDSSLEHVLETRRGVCQDYTHVMLAIARSWGIPSRYVSGYIHGDRASVEVAEASVSHAWAECPSCRGWGGSGSIRRTTRPSTSGTSPWPLGETTSMRRPPEGRSSAEGSRLWKSGSQWWRATGPHRRSPLSVWRARPFTASLRRRASRVPPRTNRAVGAFTEAGYPFVSSYSAVKRFRPSTSP